MDRSTTVRLRVLGIVILILFFMFALPVHDIFALRGEAYQDSLAASLAFGIGLLLLAEIAPIVQTFKAGGFEITLVNNKFSELETRLAELELKLARAEASAAPGTIPTELAASKKAPALERRVQRRNDQWKDRFGGASESGGFKLAADFGKPSNGVVQIFLKVTAPNQSEDFDCVEFYLHQTFDPDVLPAVFHRGEARLTLLARGGFTVGAWIPCQEVELELDLSELSYAPRIVKEL